MKIRTGLVSNSSSSSFILDLRKEGVRELVDKIVASLPQGLGRGTALAIGQDAVDFAREWEDAEGEYSNGFGHWIEGWAHRLGEDNIVFIRESDEGAGGFLFGEDPYDEIGETADTEEKRRLQSLYQQLHSLKESEQECH